MPVRNLSLAILLTAPLAAQAAEGGAVILEVDLTKGPGGLPAGTKAVGGEWRDGWLVTGNGQRVVFDAGYPIRNGMMEVSFTRWDHSVSAAAYALPAWDRVTKLVSLYEQPQLGDPEAPPGDSFRVQVGDGERARNIQGVLRANTKEEGTAWRWMQEYGQWIDWTSDDRTPMNMRFEWRNGNGTFTDIQGKTWRCARDCMSHMNSLRYLVLGNDGSCQGSPLGTRFLRARLVDFDKPAGASAQPQRQRVVFDLDLTKGAEALPAQAVVLGGEWGEGWRVTDNHQRIVIDPGYTIRNGVLEVTLTRKRARQKGDKVNLMGLHEDPNIDQADRHGDIFYLRLGMSELTGGVQGNVKAFVREGSQERGKEDGSMVWEQRFGKADDWAYDDKTPRTIKFRWQGGVGFFTDVTGQELRCPNDCDGKLDALRYVFLGGDRYDNANTLIGTRFLAVKLTDLDVPEK